MERNDCTHIKNGRCVVMYIKAGQASKVCMECHAYKAKEAKSDGGQVQD